MFTDLNMSVTHESCDCDRYHPKSLLNQAAASMVKSIPSPKRFKILDDSLKLSASMQIEIINCLFKERRLKALFNFIKSKEVWEKLLIDESYKIVPLYKIHKGLCDGGIGSIYNEIIDGVVSELCSRRRCPSEVAEYCVIPLNLASHLIDSGQFIDAVKLLEDVYDCLDVVVSQKRVTSTVRRSMGDVRILTIISLFNAYNSLLWYQKSRAMYTARTLTLHLIHDQNIAAAFLTECSRFCLIDGEILAAHKHAQDALTCCNNSGVHLRVFVNALRQATYTYMRVGKVQLARFTVIQALTISYHLWRTDPVHPGCHTCGDCMDSILFADTLLDYAEYLKEIDRYYEASKIFDAVARVSDCFLFLNYFFWVVMQPYLIYYYHVALLLGYVNKITRR